MNVLKQIKNNCMNKCALAISLSLQPPQPQCSHDCYNCPLRKKKKRKHAKDCKKEQNFTEVSQNLIVMRVFLKTCCLGGSTGISFVDSIPIRVCKSKRLRNNKVFKDCYSWIINYGLVSWI